MSAPNVRICAPYFLLTIGPVSEQIGGSARGYQGIFVPFAALSGPGYDGQPAIYLYIAVFGANVRFCRCSGDFPVAVQSPLVGQE